MTASPGFRITGHDPPPPPRYRRHPPEDQAAATWRQERQLLSRVPWHAFLCQKTFRAAAAVLSCPCCVWPLRIPNSKTGCQAIRTLAGAHQGERRRQARNDPSTLAVLLWARCWAVSLHDQGWRSSRPSTLSLRTSSDLQGRTQYRVQGTGYLLGSQPG